MRCAVPTGSLVRVAMPCGLQFASELKLAKWQETGLSDSDAFLGAAQSHPQLIQSKADRAQKIEPILLSARFGGRHAPHLGLKLLNRSSLFLAVMIVLATAFSALGI